jgi:hypothetical protein
MMKKKKIGDSEDLGILIHIIFLKGQVFATMRVYIIGGHHFLQIETDI